MQSVYVCDNKKRAKAVRDHSTLNGIDYLEVLDNDAPAGLLRQQTILVRTLKALPTPGTGLSVDNVQINGGISVTNIQIDWIARASEAQALKDDGKISDEELVFFQNLPTPQEVLIVRTAMPGDFTTYTFQLVKSDLDNSPPNNFDPVLSQIDFSFKVDCPSEFDCVDDIICPPQPYTFPTIDYLAKDYNSFRRLMFDRLSTLIPDWQERNPADVGVALVEMLAYVGDYLSYYQDTVATEAYLGTARKRVSVRRHARTLDYQMHDGCNARTWLCLYVNAQVDIPEPDPVNSPASVTLFSTKPSTRNADRQESHAVIFQALHGATLLPERNQIEFYTWGDADCCLPRGSTAATLIGDSSLGLVIGDTLVFEELQSPTTGRTEDSDPEKRWAVRIVNAEPLQDPVNGEWLWNVEWHKSDALPFPLCLSATVDGLSITGLTVARGNVILVDNGVTVQGRLDIPDILPNEGRYRPRLATQNNTNITFRVPYKRHDTSLKGASTLTRQDPREALPAVMLKELNSGEIWRPQKDLLASDRFATEFVLETEDDGTAQLRFGDGLLGKALPSGVSFLATYHIGAGVSGNVGQETITELLSPINNIESLRNPLPAVGGVNPESTEEVRQFAPQAFKTQRRAVTEADYVRIAEEHPEVQKASARYRWTGSWHTVFVTIDRTGGQTVDDDPLFKQEMLRWLNQFRLAGYDLEIAGPVFVPLDIEMKVCVQPGRYRADVKRDLLKAFSRFDLPGQGRGFFHPDNFTFGQPLYLSSMYERAMRVQGVASVEIMRAVRWNRKANGEVESGKLTTGRLEIIQLDNNRSAPENGKIEFMMQGGI